MERNSSPDPLHSEGPSRKKQRAEKTVSKRGNDGACKISSLSDQAKEQRIDETLSTPPTSTSTTSMSSTMSMSTSSMSSYIPSGNELLSEAADVTPKRNERPYVSLSPSNCPWPPQVNGCNIPDRLLALQEQLRRTPQNVQLQLDFAKLCYEYNIQMRKRFPGLVPFINSYMALWAYSSRQEDEKIKNTVQNMCELIKGLPAREQALFFLDRIHLQRIDEITRFICPSMNVVSGIKCKIDTL